MELRRWKNFCLCAPEPADFPPEAVATEGLFSPLVILTRRDPRTSRAWVCLRSADAIYEPEDTGLLLPPQPADAPETLRNFIAAHGATLLNTAFTRAFDFLAAKKRTSGIRLTLVGLGDVGGTLLIALKLLGAEISELRIYDPNEALCARWEMELNQVLSPDAGTLPPVTICTKETLFDCDLLLFSAARGVPAVGAVETDVRMAQYQCNRAILIDYARQARQSHFLGLFCQISDPVDHLSRAVFLASNRNAQGEFDAAGLLPEQVQGFGLGVMAARAAYYARRDGIPFTEGRLFGPHGGGLIVADHPTDYHDEISLRLTQETLHANLRVRELGFKPYIAPALSSAAASILRLLRGQTHYGAVPLGGTYFGCRSRMTAQGLYMEREPLHPQLLSRIETTYRQLKDFCYD